MILIKGLREPAKKSLKTEIRFIKGKETKEEAGERFQNETKDKMNAMKQVSALISFKDALCTGTYSIVYLRVYCVFVVTFCRGVTCVQL